MPWCPKCKMEYVEGKTICTDCNTELVDELPETPELESFLETEKKLQAEKFIKFLEYSNIHTAVLEHDEEKQIWKVLIDKKQIKQVKKLYNAFYSVEAEQFISEMMDKEDVADNTDESNEEASSDLESNTTTSNSTLTIDDNVTKEQSSEEDDEVDYQDAIKDIESESYDNDSYDSMFDQEEMENIVKSTVKEPVRPTLTYVKKEEQYKDLKSSAFTFFAVSLLGIAVLIINYIGIINIFEGLLPYTVMGLLFIIFIYIGITSLIKANKVQKEVGEENRVTEAITTWLTDNVTSEQLDSLTSSDNSDEVRFFHKLEIMKGLVIKEFGELNDAYLDRICEEYYNNHFE